MCFAWKRCTCILFVLFEEKDVHRYYLFSLKKMYISFICFVWKRCMQMLLCLKKTRTKMLFILSKKGVDIICFAWNYRRYLFCLKKKWCMWDVTYFVWNKEVDIIYLSKNDVCRYVLFCLKRCAFYLFCLRKDV